jgi:peptidoglycan/xylan/chitin deacetylase (PgdA/CDA1 family)
MYGNGVRPEKRMLARALGAMGINGALMRAQVALLGGRFVRAVNYHDTSADHASSFARQVAWYAQHYAPVTPASLDALVRDGVWHEQKPGLIISFDDGLRSNFDVAAPVLEHYGFVGWFFVPVGFVDAPEATQSTYAHEHQIQFSGTYPDGRIAMSWEELRRLASRHVIGCHTRTHRRLSPDVPPATLEDEILTAREDLAMRLGRDVDAFCWVGGEENTYSAEAARVVRRAGYRFAFMTNNAVARAGTDPMQLQRTNIEAAWDLDVVHFQLSGVMDALYAPKRRRVNRLTAR